VTRTSIALALLVACGSRNPPAAPPASPPVAAVAPPDAAPPDAAPPDAELRCDPPVPAVGRPVALLCDLPDRVITVLADGIDEGAVHGTARSVDRATGKVTTAALRKDSDGCTGMMKCHYDTNRKGMKHLWVHADEWVYTWGQVGDRDDAMVACRPHDMEAIAVCVTRDHSASLVPTGCHGPAATDADLVVDLYDAAQDPLDDDGFEIPTQEVPAHLVEVPADGDPWVYRGDDVELSFDLGAPANSTLRLANASPEPCLDFALYERPPG
jgi:hypothetical protein